MTARSAMLDEAFSLGQKELSCLTEGDVFEAEKLAKDRERILDEALGDLSKEHLEKLADKIVAMQSLHREITGVAKRLHQSLKNDLTGLKKQNRRIAGYSYGAGNMPRLAKERFVSKKG